MKHRIWLAFLLIYPFAAMAQETAAPASPEPEQEQKIIEFHGELKAHFRWSEDSKFPLRFPFTPDQIPRGQTQVFERTVSPGSSLEVSMAAVIMDLHLSDSVTGKVRIQFIDLYNRNPTSDDQTVNVKEAWMLFGRRTDFLQEVDRSQFYLLFGKAPKFERQPDRNMESYGLVSTAFNRFEDLQLQVGANAGSHLYFRGQVSAGNPVFFRDPNALAGDNGVNAERFPNPELSLNSGFPIIYDAEVEELSTRDMEAGGGAGVRFQSDDGEKGLDVLGFYYQRDLADRVALRGTFYGGDLDILDGVGGIGLPIHGRKKQEYGANIEGRFHHLSVFFQGVHQEIAGLTRNGYEVETLFRLPLPLKFSTGGKQLFTFVQPVFRFSMLDNNFGPVPQFVAPSMFWDWKKYDLGVRLGIISGVDWTLEYTKHDITTILPVNIDEFLATLRVRL